MNIQELPFKDFQHLTPELFSSIPLYCQIKRINPYLDPPQFVKTISTPVIAIFCQPCQDIQSKHGLHPFTPASYVQWIQSAGAVCTPLPYDLTEVSYKNILSKVNGLVIPGGSANLWKNFQKKEGTGNVLIGFKKIWKILNEMWQNGVHFPVWGTCLGFQICLLALTNQQKCLNSLDSRHHSKQFYSDYESSRIFKDMPSWMRNHVQTQPAINFNHCMGYSLKRYLESDKYKVVRQQLALISVTKDKSDNWFCAFLEGRKYPLFLSQFHPQKQQFEEAIMVAGSVIKSGQNVLISQFLSTKFVNQCRKNNNKFESKQDRDKSLIYNFSTVFQHDRYFRLYLINPDYKKSKLQKKARSNKK